MTKPTLRTFTCGDMLLNYIGEPGGLVAMQLLPVSSAEAVVPPRPNLGATPDAPQIPRFLEVGLRAPEPLIHVRRSGDVHADGHDTGRTLRYCSTTRALVLREITADTSNGLDVVVSMATPDGLVAEHHVTWRPGWQALRVWTELVNTGATDTMIELVTSVSIGGLSPFAEDDAPGQLFIHRFRAGWSSEGRHERIPAEALGLERAWAPFSMMTERFGQIGTKPVRTFVPWVGVEDAQAGVLWATQLEAPGSWQCELSRRDDGLSLAGGLADREFGHWTKRLQPGERFATPAAWVTSCHGDIDDACNRLVHQQGPVAPAAVDRELPVMFNEWCTTWGTPSHENLVVIADCLRGLPCRYLVIDAGWYKGDTGDWGCGQGDWKPSAELFPDGLAATCEAIRQRGLVPGLWFEFEVAGTQSALFADETRFLTLDGHLIQAGSRRFLDMRQQRNHDLLETRVIDLLEQCGIGYIKVDQNGSLGIGCDGAESLGEGLRQHVAGVMRFFRRMRERLPELVIENCSSGGQRIEPSFGELADMHSFSDAHTCHDIPIVAANVARFTPPYQNQIWAVLLASEDEQRLVYSLAAGFLGRLCLSGEIQSLDDSQLALVRRAAELYGKAAPIIRSGISRRTGNWSASSRQLTGWQAVIREGSGGGTLVVLHVFGDGATPDRQAVPHATSIRETLVAGDARVTLADGCLQVSGMRPWSAAVVVLD